MLNTKQRWVVFVLFCLFAIVCVALEIYSVYLIIAKGPSNIKAILAISNGLIVFAFGRLFLQITTKTFLKVGMTPDRLHRSSSERFRIVEGARQSGQDVYFIRRELIVNTLKFMEGCLQGWVPGSHFEFCVFVDQQQPFMFAYFDSNHVDNHRSVEERRENPYWYVEKGYEVTKLLKAPSSHPRILNDTFDPKAKYFFASDQQKKQLISTALFCIDISTPCALVVTSDEKNAFAKNDAELMSFLKYIASLVRYDLFEENFIHQIRALRPGYFTNEEASPERRPGSQRAKRKSKT